MHMTRRSGTRLGGCSGGFTLVELLVVVAILALLISLLLPALGRARDVAITVRCASNLRQIGVAAGTYTTDNNSYMLPGNADPNARLSSGFSNISWHRLLSVQYMDASGGALRCPAIPTIGLPQGSPQRNRGQFNPTNSSSEARFNTVEWSNGSDGTLTAASYIMNLMANSPLAGAGWTTGSTWNGATELQAMGLDPRRIRGWSGWQASPAQPTPAGNGLAAFGAYPVSIDKARDPGGTVFIFDHRPDVFNTTALTANFSDAMLQGVVDFRQTDWTSTIDNASSPRLRVGRFVHANSPSTTLGTTSTNANVNDPSRFNVLYADFHVDTVAKTSQLSWVAAID